MRVFLSIAILSYLLGSIPFGYLLVRIFRGEDVRQSGSGNVGATNVARKSPLLGVLTLLLDAGKGLAAVLLSSMLVECLAPNYSGSELQAFAALCAVAGHMFPVWLKFRGGKGVATGLGSFALIAPKATLAAAVVFVVVVAVSRYVSLGSIVAVAAFPALAWWFHQQTNLPIVIATMSLASLMIILKHHENVRRLLAGTENRFGAKRA